LRTKQKHVKNIISVQVLPLVCRVW